MRCGRWRWTSALHVFFHLFFFAAAGEQHERRNREQLYDRTNKSRGFHPGIAKAIAMPLV